MFVKVVEYLVGVIRLALIICSSNNTEQDAEISFDGYLRCSSVNILFGIGLYFATLVIGQNCFFAQILPNTYKSPLF